MILALQALPLLLLIGLLFSGRVAPVPAVLAALAAAIPAAFVSLPGGVGLPGFLGEQILRGAYLALQPMGVVLAGCYFTPPFQKQRPQPAQPPQHRGAFSSRRFCLAAFWKVSPALALGRFSRWRACAAWALSARRPAPWRCWRFA